MLRPGAPSLASKVTSAPETLAPLKSRTVPATLADASLGGVVAKGPWDRETPANEGAEFCACARVLAETTHNSRDAQAKTR